MNEKGRKRCSASGPALLRALRELRSSSCPSCLEVDRDVDLRHTRSGDHRRRQERAAARDGVILLEARRRIDVEQVQQIDGDVGPRALEVQDLAEARSVRLTRSL
jgi:hypothetical protein